MISASEIVRLALQCGFDDAAATPACLLADDARYMEQWIDAGLHGQLDYLARNTDKRYDPRCLVPGAETVVVAVLHFDRSGHDYHRTMKSKLYELEKLLVAKYGESIVAPTQHIFCDSAPFLERRWAVRAGLGQIARNRQFVHPRWGSKVHLAELVLNEPLDEPRPPVQQRLYPDACTDCQQCLDACPTGALRQPQWNVTLCTAYATHHCLVCQDVCPLNTINNLNI